MVTRRLACLLLLLVGCRAAAALPPPAGQVEWRSAATDSVLKGELFLPRPSDVPPPAVVYLRHLSIPRLGRDGDEAIVNDLLAEGHLVLVLDYGRHPKAVSPLLNADVLKLRQDIAGKARTLLADQNLDVDRLFVLAEGFRLRRDVEFARDGDRVLGMDVIYPASPAEAVPVLMEVTCDNARRMGAYSLLYCRDTLMEGAQFVGFAAAMVDHPVAPPYKGIDSFPADLRTMQSAVRKLRSLGLEVGMSGAIGAMGFSRGGPPVGMLAARGEGDSAIQAALVHGNRYDYLDLLPDDPMRERFEAAWGPPDANRQRWVEQGVVHFVTRDTAPMFLNTSIAESPEYRRGLEQLRRALRHAGVEHVYRVDQDDRGHQVATDPATLEAIYSFFRKHLRPE